jgi:hypothetical protein
MSFDRPRLPLPPIRRHGRYPGISCRRRDARGRGGIRLNHIAEDGPIVFAHACRLGAEGIVSKRIDSTYQSGPCRVRINVGNPASIAARRERSETWKR